MKKIWFKAKTYGYGWYPVTWQGWLIIVGYIVVVVLAAIFTIDTKSPDAAHGIGLFLIIETIAVITLILLARKYGEKARWRWGKKE